MATQTHPARIYKSATHRWKRVGLPSLTTEDGRFRASPLDAPESISHEMGPADLMTSRLLTERTRQRVQTSAALVRPVGSHPHIAVNRRDPVDQGTEAVSPQRVCLTSTLIVPQGEESMSRISKPEGLKPAQASGAPPTAEVRGHPRLKARARWERADDGTLLLLPDVPDAARPGTRPAAGLCWPSVGGAWVWVTQNCERWGDELTAEDARRACLLAVLHASEGDDAAEPGEVPA